MKKHQPKNLSRQALEEKAIELRTQHQMTIKEIAEALGHGRYTIGAIVKGIPLRQRKKEGVKTPQEVIDRIIELREVEGMFTADIGKQVGLHLWTVEKHLRAAGKLYKPKTGHIPSATKTEIKRLHLEGKSYREIGLAVGEEPLTCHYYLRASGRRKKRRKRRNISPKKIEEARRLRREERMSGVEISRRTGISPYKLNEVLANDRLTPREKRINVQKSKYQNIERKARNLRQKEKLSAKEIAKRLKVGVNTIRSYLRDLPLSDDEKKDNLTQSLEECGVLTRTNKGIVYHERKDRGEESLMHKLTSGTKMTKVQKGCIAETAIRARLSLHGIEVYSTHHEKSLFDIVTYSADSDKLHRVQVRYFKFGIKKSMPTISVRRSGGSKKKYTSRECEFLIGYNLYTDTAYIYTIKDISDISHILVLDERAKERWHLLK